MTELPPDLAAAALLGGEAGRCFAAFDWEHHRLGPPATWPEAMRTMVAASLASRFPVVLWLGDDLTMVYNDGYIPMLADKHPWAMGTPGLEVWWEIRDIIEPMLAGVVDTGVATWSDDLLLMLVDHGRPWEKYFTFTYSPIFLHEGTVGGVFCAVFETTDRVLGERRLLVLNRLGALLVDAKSVHETVTATVKACAEQPADLPFVAIYLNDPTSGSAVLTGCSEHLRAALERSAPTASSWWEPLTIETTGAVVSDLPARFGILGDATRPGMPERALVLPLADPTATSTMGVLVVGLNPNRPLDEQYRGFCRLLGDQVAAGIASAQAYEAERERARSLAELDRAKTVFLTNVSHELRTPLTLMLGPVDDALALVGDDPMLREHLEVVDRSARRLLRLVNSLLDFARIEAGRATAQLVEVDVAELTAEVASSFSDICRRAGIDLVIESEQAVGRVDAEMWETIVLNLLSNAFKFTFEGSIAVRVAPVAGEIELSVTDTGVGIPAAEQQRIFERFYRPAMSAGRTMEGSGIGLALVQNLIALHGGTVSVASVEGQGTTFTVRVPTALGDESAAKPTVAARGSAGQVYVTEAAQWLANGAGAPKAPPIAPPGELARPIVLVADDNADLRAHLERVIGSRWTVISAPDGEAALDLARRYEPDLVVADVMMPKLDGLELIEVLRATPELESIPVLFLSARAGPEAAGEAVAAGAVDYLVKPFRSSELLSRVAARLKLAAHERERRDRERIELGRASMLAELGAALSAAGSLQEVAAGILASPLRASGLSSVGLGVIDGSAGLVRMTYAGQLEAEITDRYHTIAFDAPVPVAQALATGRTVSIADMRAVDPTFQAVADDVVESIKAALVEPLTGPDGSAVGVLTLHWRAPRVFSAEERDLATGIAAIAARAVGRVQRAERERLVAVALQERLLEWGAHSAPAAMWTVYQPAGDSMRVGGDWYTITALDDRGRIGLSVGDVVGHGLAAATVMSELRSALAAAALALHEPEAVLGLLERYAAQVPGAQCTTAAYVLVDPDSSSIRYACAGHPYPVVVTPDGRARLLEDGRRPALAVGARRGGASRGVAEFPPGSLLILFTDGLIERRNESIDTGLERLLETTRALAQKPVGEVCAGLLDSLRGPHGYDDDVALVALRPSGATDTSYVDAFAATPAGIPGVRARLRAWLHERGLDADAALNVLVATSEALANAVQHGSNDEVGSMVTLEAFLSSTELTTTVTDNGRWEADSADSRRAAVRGRGITLMHAMSDRVDIARHELGTRVTMHYHWRSE